MAAVLALQRSAGNQAVQRMIGARPLDADARGRMEHALGVPLGDVRIDTAGEGARLAEATGSRAVTIGRDVGFAPGEYRPGTPGGDALLAHELAHVVQQRGATEVDDAPAADAALEDDANQTTVAATASLWSRAGAGLSRLARAALPRLRSGLRMQSCRGGTVTAPPRVTPEQVSLTGGHPLTPAMGDAQANPVWTPAAADHATAYTKGTQPLVSGRFRLGAGFTLPSPPAAAPPASGGSAAPPTDGGAPAPAPAASDGGAAAPAASGSADAGVAAAPAPPLQARVLEAGAVRGQGTAAKAGDLVTVPNIALAGLTDGNVIGAKSYQLAWEASVDGGVTWVPVTTTGLHPIYWTADTPRDLPARNYAVRKAVGYANGAPDSATAAARIRSGPRRVDGLTYNPADPINPDPLTVFTDGVGICTDYGNLLTLLARAAGLNANVVMFWGGFQAGGRNVWITVAGALGSLKHVRATDPAFNPPLPADGWDFTYHAISRIDGVFHDSALDRSGIDAQAVHQGRTVYLVDGDPAGPPPATKGTAYSQPLPRRPQTVAVAIRDYGTQLTLPQFADVFAVGATAAATPIEVPVSWVMTAGALPPGLTLNPLSGLLSGTPTAAGAFPITLTLMATGTGSPLLGSYSTTVNVAP